VAESSSRYLSFFFLPLAPRQRRVPRRGAVYIFQTHLFPLSPLCGITCCLLDFFSLSEQFSLVHCYLPTTFILNFIFTPSWPLCLFCVPCALLRRGSPRERQLGSRLRPTTDVRNCLLISLPALFRLLLRLPNSLQLSLLKIPPD